MPKKQNTLPGKTVQKKCISRECASKGATQHVSEDSIICTFCNQPTLHSMEK